MMVMMTKKKFHKMTDKELLMDLYEVYCAFHDVLGKMIREEIDFNDPAPEIKSKIPYLALIIRDLLAIINLIRDSLDCECNVGLLLYQYEMYQEINRRWGPFGLKKNKVTK